MPEPMDDAGTLLLLRLDPEPPHDVGSKPRRSTFMPTVNCLFQLVIGEIWEVTIICKDKQRILDITIDEGAITFVNLSHFREQLGYSSRDFCFYKKRCGTDEATLEFVDTGREIEDMVQEVSNTKERKLRLILSKEYEPEGERVNITPLKRRREIQSDDDEEDDTIGFDESINEYKDWLRDLLRDEDDTILTHETNNTTQDEARSPEENNVVTPMRGQETPNQIEPTSMVTTDRENVNPNCNTRAASKVSKNLFTDNRVNGPPAKFITSQQLLSGAKTRASKRKQDSQA
ncbi:hypothetical protein EJB05_56850 [Eragrostis curvula]|uniref:Uncharacterized protein n=1 Tax=Eragrostis curvula TaxID=38414 RepID=A0A5J9SF81_9POAL|nr:hypothetical protein EJB05_56850 [Eragrostis curvula]